MRRKVVSLALLALVLAAIGALAVVAGQPWLVPSLGSAAFVQLLTPTQPSARIWHIGAGQVAGMAAGYAGVFAAGAATIAPFMEEHPLSWTRVLAVLIAAPLAAAALYLVRAVSPAAGAVMLLVALGNEPPTWHGAFVLLVGIALVTVLGEAARLALLKLT